MYIGIRRRFSFEITFFALVNTYTISTFTGDLRGAGTDSNVFITIFGDLGDSGQKLLDTKENNFERGKKDIFPVKCPNVGKVSKIRIGQFMFAILL